MWLSRLISGDIFKDKENLSVNEVLDRAEGFADTGDHFRLATCRSVVEQVVERILATGRSWKVRERIEPRTETL